MIINFLMYKLINIKLILFNKNIIIIFLKNSFQLISFKFKINFLKFNIL